jgi:hypothetical protein
MIEVESMAVKMPEVKGHPNRAEFRGVLTVVDVASQRAPAGSKGHRVVLTRAAAEAALPSLLGMALDYAPSLDRHDQRRKVGVITSAEIVGRNLEVGGYLYAKDFPEIVREIGKDRRKPLTPSVSSGQALAAKNTPGVDHPRMSLTAAVEKLRNAIKTAPGGSTSICARNAEADSQRGLGMSYEVTDVAVADTRAHVWMLTHVTFTGAAILRRNRAAYEETWIALVANPEL